jgi:hypothetical protein
MAMFQCLAPALAAHPPACGCAALPRRGLFGIGAGLLLAGSAHAVSGAYEACC